jgi:hypothetical protein
VGILEITDEGGDSRTDDGHGSSGLVMPVVQVSETTEEVQVAGYFDGLKS